MPNEGGSGLSESALANLRAIMAADSENDNVLSDRQFRRQSDNPRFSVAGEDSPPVPKVEESS